METSVGDCWIGLPLPVCMEMSEDDNNMEEYPTEIHDYLTAFEKSLGSVDEMLKTMMSVSRNELLQKLDPLEQAKLDLVSVYTLNSMFWVYLATQGINPKEHPVKQELMHDYSTEGLENSADLKNRII
ncbi:nuclear nucleic acid-binding protein C1D isoform X1 [Taeniopygia guttata]|uniref:nuclear nucleic acid-binding protein C1D isoform X1 n=1 Tax=Taeniopygia guttata TaxID=59729 RepID=UPI0011AF16BA|nr:nuclear nucleic acid-binding protein C1D isoform X2 [Taeniopygia guttata]